MNYFSYSYKLNHTVRWVIWYSEIGGEPDGVLLDEHGKLLVFESIDELAAHLEIHGLALTAYEGDADKIGLDLDELRRWLEFPNAQNVDCELFLNSWNFFSDCLTSRAGCLSHIDDSTENDVNEKLFYGCNLPTVTPPGEHYVPRWSEEEVETLREVLGRGLSIFLDMVP